MLGGVADESLGIIGCFCGSGGYRLDVREYKLGDDCADTDVQVLVLLFTRS